MITKLLFIQVVSRLTINLAQRWDEIGIPISREKPYTIGFIPGSTLKGYFQKILREIGTSTQLFGINNQDLDGYGSQMLFTDARILLLPVQSSRGVWAWVTSPLLLSSLLSDARNVETVALPAFAPTPSMENACLVASDDCELCLTNNATTQIILADLHLAVETSHDFSSWAAILGEMIFPLEPERQDELKGRLCLVSDNMLSNLLDMAVEISARVRLPYTEKKTELGDFWYQEAFPSETVFISLVYDKSEQGKSSEFSKH